MDNFQDLSSIHNFGTSSEHHDEEMSVRSKGFLATVVTNILPLSINQIGEYESSDFLRTLPYGVVNQSLQSLQYSYFEPGNNTFADATETFLSTKATYFLYREYKLH